MNSSVGSEKPFRRTSPMRSNSSPSMPIGDVDDGARHEHLSAARARDHARGLVDLAPEVVAVAVDRLAVVDADPRRRLARRRCPSCSVDRPLGERRRVGADDHHLVAERLDHARVDRQRLRRPPRRSARPCSPPPRRPLDGQPRVAREVGERDRHAQAPFLPSRPRRGRPPCGRSCPARRSGTAGGRAGSS